MKDVYDFIFNRMQRLKIIRSVLYDIYMVLKLYLF